MQGAMVKKIIVAVFLFLPVFASANCELSVRVSQYKPQYYQDDQGVWQGLAVELTQALFKEANCKVKFVSMPWKRGQHLLEFGGLDVVLNMSKTKSREKFTHFIGPMLDETLVLMIKQNAEYNISNLDDIKALPKRIGITRGVFYGEELMSKLKNDQPFFRQFEFGSIESNMEKLHRDRILGIINNQYTAAYRINHQLEKGQYKQHPFVFHQSSVYFGFSKKGVSDALLVIFEAAFVRLQEKGDFQKISAAYR